jgi:hypothetical protein
MIRFLSRLRRKLNLLEDLDRRVRRVQEALGRIENRQVASAGLADAEFRVYSQWGEDGILQHLLRHTAIERRLFVEFGVQDYRESNTRFLLANNNWSGLIIDGSRENVARIVSDDIYWQHNLKAVCAFVTRENINQLLRDNGLEGDIGLLSIDIDGNDYWVWEAIDVVSPVLVAIEYNWRFGPARRVSIPYDPAFVRERAHSSMVYYGAGLAALHALGKRKGYDLVGCNSAGNNAFFVRADRRPSSLSARKPADCFVAGRFREARGVDGSMTGQTPEEECAILADLPVLDVGGPEGA